MKILLSLLLAVCTLSVSAVESCCFKAMLNGKIAVEVALQTVYNVYEGQSMTAGYIYYPKAKNPAPILIVEHWGEEKHIAPKEKGVVYSRFVEYQPDGEITGLLYLTYSGMEENLQVRKSSWKNPTTGRVLQLTNIETLDKLPAWFPGTPAVLSTPNREALIIWKRVYNLENEDSEWLNKLEVSVQVGEKELMTIREDLCSPFTSDQEETLQWVNEDEDINFDGIADLQLYIGFSTRGQSIYKAYVWNPITRQFYPVQEFDEIQEPSIDPKTKTITSTIREADGLYVDTWKWKNGKLKKISEKHIPVQ